MKKYTIAEICKNRKVGNIGKHSTYEEMVSEFGEPHYIRDTFEYKERTANIAIYGDIVFGYMARKKLITDIGIRSEKILPHFCKGVTKPIMLIKDFNKVNKMQIDDFIKYFDDNDEPIVTNEKINEGTGAGMHRFIPQHNKRFTIYEPKFLIYFDDEEKRFRSIDMWFNYDSKFR